MSYLDDFKQDSKLQIWSRYPFITAEEDEFTDTFACKQVSEFFLEFLTKLGMPAQLVRADGWDDPYVGEHYWVECDGYAFDWTARQFHNVDGLEQRALEAPWPLMWDARDPHPLLGTPKEKN